MSELDDAFKRAAKELAEEATQKFKELQGDTKLEIMKKAVLTPEDVISQFTVTDKISHNKRDGLQLRKDDSPLLNFDIVLQRKGNIFRDEEQYTINVDLIKYNSESYIVDTEKLDTNDKGNKEFLNKLFVISTEFGMRTGNTLNEYIDEDLINEFTDEVVKGVISKVDDKVEDGIPEFSISLEKIIDNKDSLDKKDISGIAKIFKGSQRENVKEALKSLNKEMLNEAFKTKSYNRPLINVLEGIEREEGSWQLSNYHKNQSKESIYKDLMVGTGNEELLNKPKKSKGFSPSM